MYCNSCNSKFLNFNFNLGKHYKWSEFSKEKKRKKFLKKNEITLVKCSFCNLIQIKKPIDAKKITPTLKWIINKEETKHHNKIASTFLKKYTNKKKIFLAISHYDSEILKKLKKKKFNNLKTLSLARDFNIINKNKLRQEVIQSYLNKKFAKKFVKKNGKVDVLICSKVLEHTQKISNFFTFCNYILNENGLIIIDVPDCQKSLEQGNVSMIWEEHISYFTENSLNNTLSIHGFSKSYFKSFFYKQENALVGIYRKKKKSEIASKIKIYKDNEYLKSFKKKILFTQNTTKNFFKKLKKNNCKITMFGAGHNSIAFINYIKIKKYISFILDDGKNKKNLTISGTKLVIKSSDYLKNIKRPVICLLALNIPIEKKIISHIKKNVKSNIKFLSIYPDSPIFFLKNVKKYK